MGEACFPERLGIAIGAHVLDARLVRNSGRRVYALLNMRSCASADLKEEIGEKKIVCFGAGSHLRRFLEENQDLTGQISCVIDNNKELNGTLLYGFPVMSVEAFVKQGTRDFVLIITVARFRFCNEIIDQLDAMAHFDGIDCYLNAVNRTAAPKTSVSFLRGEQKIPKIIHYGWFGKTEIPKHLQEYIDTWKACCPDYTVMRWDEGNYDVEKNRYMRQAYEHKKYAFVADYFRLDIVSEYGGICLDTDVELLKNLDSFLTYDFFAGFEYGSRGNVINLGMGFGAAKGCPILYKLLESYEEKAFVEHGKIDYTPCPVLQSAVLSREGFAMDGSYQCRDGVALFPQEMFGDLPFEIKENNYSIHHYEASWLAGSGDLKAEEWKKDTNQLHRFYRERIRGMR